MLTTINKPHCKLLDLDNSPIALKSRVYLALARSGYFEQCQRFLYASQKAITLSDLVYIARCYIIDTSVEFESNRLS